MKEPIPCEKCGKPALPNDQIVHRTPDGDAVIHYDCGEHKFHRTAGLHGKGVKFLECDCAE